MYTFTVAMLAGMILTGCSSSEEIPGGIPDKGPKLMIETRSADAAEAAYAHRAILVSEGNIADAKSAADAASLGAFSVEPGSYTVYAVASSDEANLTFTGVAASNAVADARVKITDISAQIPELLVGNSDVVTVGAKGAAAALQLKRVVASVTVTVSGLENVDAESITLTIGNMYDQVSLDGAFSKSGAAFASKSLVLTKNAEGKFVGNAIVMPTDTEASNLSLTYSVNGTDYTSTPAGRIAANGQYELATTVEAGSSSSKVNLNSAITYAAWDSTVVNLSALPSTRLPLTSSGWVRQPFRSAVQPLLDTTISGRRPMEAILAGARHSGSTTSMTGTKRTEATIGVLPNGTARLPSGISTSALPSRA